MTALAGHPYASPEYASAFTPQFEPFAMDKSGFSVLLRPIAGTNAIDAMGCYPLCPLARTEGLEEDFAALKARAAVSLVLVTDTFFQPEEAQLRAHFDHVLAYKEHYINDFTLPNLYESKNHHYKVRRALRDCDVKIIPLADYLEQWCALYDDIIAKHDINGIQAFSKSYFRALCDLAPVTVGAFVAGELVACQINLAYEEVAYSHLVASNAKGYEMRAAYALYDFSLQYFRDHGVKQYDLGSGAGVSDASGGLTMLKKGFATTAKQCFLVGKILDKARYEELSAGKAANFFPAYRGS